MTLACLVLFLVAACQQTLPTLAPAAPDPMIEAYQQAKKKVEEGRGEPSGRNARIIIPKELLHYADRRRFLALQYAAWSEFHNEIPQDYLELLELIEKGSLVEMAALGEAYLLYGVGEMSDREPFSYYDAATGENLTLYKNSQEFAAAQIAFDASLQQLQKQSADLQTQRLASQDANLKGSLATRLKALQEAIDEVTLKKNLGEFFYTDPVRREMLFARYRWLANAAANFRGQAYDLQDPASRHQFKMRLLSFIRPEARRMILQVAALYKEKFGRPLPITSLIRTQQYQNQLRETNANAAKVDVPPHTTGLAFDIFNGWMSAAEQNFLMTEIARLEASGRVEALRENRDHIHVFTFAIGKPPAEERVAQALK